MNDNNTISREQAVSLAGDDVINTRDILDAMRDDDSEKWRVLEQNYGFAIPGYFSDYLDPIAVFTGVNFRGNLLRYFLRDSRTDSHQFPLNEIVAYLTASRNNFYRIVDELELHERIRDHIPQILARINFSDPNISWWREHYPELSLSGCLENDYFRERLAEAVTVNFDDRYYQFEKERLMALAQILTKDHKKLLFWNEKDIVILGVDSQLEGWYQIGVNGDGTPIYSARNKPELTDDIGEYLIPKKKSAQSCQ